MLACTTTSPLLSPVVESSSKFPAAVALATEPATTVPVNDEDDAVTVSTGAAADVPSDDVSSMP